MTKTHEGVGGWATEHMTVKRERDAALARVKEQEPQNGEWWYVKTLSKTSADADKIVIACQCVVNVHKTWWYSAEGNLITAPVTPVIMMATP